MPTQQIISINVGQAQDLKVGDKWVRSAIRKRPIAKPDVDVKPLGLVGDEQVNLSVHGGLAKAVYAYPAEHYPYWQVGETPLPWGTLGENLTLTGLLETEAFIGDELHFPDCVLAITEPREPCAKFNAVLDDVMAGKRMHQSGFSGFYLSVVQVGTLRVGQTYTVVPGARNHTVAKMFQG